MAIALCAAFGAACKPVTEEDKFRRALRRGNAEQAREQLDGGKDANYEFGDGRRPLHIVAALAHGEPETVRLLTERGAQVNAVDREGLRAWDLVTANPPRSLSEDDTAVLLVLLDAGFVPPRPTLEGGRTLLHEVAERMPSARLVSVLVNDHGFEVDARDDAGWTPLHVAIHDNNTEAATGLLAEGADANAETSQAVGRSHQKGERVIVDWRYEAGSHPLDVVSRDGVGRHEKDARKVVEQYGGTRNGAIKNRPR